MKFLKLKILIFLTLLYSPHIYANQIEIVTEDLPPYNYLKKDKIVGISTDIVKVILKKTNIKATINLYNWNRAYHLAKFKKNVLIYSIARNSEREKLFKWVGPIIRFSTHIYGLKTRKDIKINKLKDISKYKIATVRNDEFALHLLREGLKEGKDFTYSSKEEINIKNLFVKRLDLTGNINFYMIYKCKQLGYDYKKLKIFYTLPGKKSLYLAFNKKTSDKIVTKFQKALSKLKKDGTYQKIINQYLN